MTIKITADSTCDLKKEWREEHNVSTTPLSVLKEGIPYLDGVEITVQEIYRHVAGGGQLCKTSAVNVGEYMEHFKKYASEYDAVIHINIGSGFSACHQNAMLAAEEFSNVYVIDSQNLSTGEGHLVIEAVKRAEAGMDAEQIVEEVKALVPKLETTFIIDTMEYLQKGGRCSSLAALGATVLRLKPSINLVENELLVGKKYRGNLEKCLRQYIQDKMAGRQDIDLRRIFITHGYCSDEIVAMVKEEIMKFQPFEEVLVTYTGSTISCHCGPNTVGLLYMRK